MNHIYELALRRENLPGSETPLAGIRDIRLPGNETLCTGKRDT